MRQCGTFKCGRLSKTFHEQCSKVCYYYTTYFSILQHIFVKTVFFRQQCTKLTANNCTVCHWKKERVDYMKKQSFIKGSLILMLSAVAAKILGAFFKIPLTNILGGIGMSYFSCAYSLFMPVYALTVTGVSSAVARMTAQSMALGMAENARKIRRTALLVFSAAGLAGSILTFLLAKPFSVYSVNSPQAAAAVAMISPAVFFGCITAVERGYYEGLSNMYPTALSQVAEGVVKVFGGLWLCGYVTSHSEDVMRFFPGITDVRAVAAAAGIMGVTLSSLGAVLFFAVLRLFSRREISAEKTVMSGRRITRELIGTALPTGISALVTNLTALIDMWTVIGCISYFGTSVQAPLGVSPEELPHFIYGSFAGIAITVFNLVPSVTNMLGKGALTCITDHWESGRRSALERSSSQAILTSLVIAVPAAAGMIVLAPEIMAFLFPRQSDEVAVCINSLRLMMPGMVFLCVSYPLFSMLQAIGKPVLPLKIMLLGTAVKLVGNLVLIPSMGVDGAALSTTICYGVILAVSLTAFVRASGVHISAAPVMGVLYAGIMCGGTAYLTASAAESHSAGEMTVIILSALTGGITYILTVLYTGKNSFGKEKILKKGTPCK